MEQFSVAIKAQAGKLLGVRSIALTHGLATSLFPPLMLYRDGQTSQQGITCSRRQRDKHETDHHIAAPRNC